MNKFLISCMIIVSLAGLSFSQEDELLWPREIETSECIITLYQPQLESFKKDTLQGRIAVAIKPDKGEMMFCAVWFKARLDTDFDQRIATLVTVDITRVHFPEIDEEDKINSLKEFLEKEIESWDLVMSLDRLIAGLEEVDDLQSQAARLNNDPPQIYFRTSPTILVSIDGDPIIKDIENDGLSYVVNTPFFIVKEKNQSANYLRGGKFWYRSDDILSGWMETQDVPQKILKLAETSLSPGEPDSVSAAMKEAPDIIVSTKPAELITTDGEPDYASIGSTTLLYVKNSESDIVMDIHTQDHYILLAGRWYHSRSLRDGDWRFCEPSELPADFKNIPEKSDMANIRASVPGTPEAQDALLEQNIPQTATVDRKTATVQVSYDGDPQFNQVEGTKVAYAVNTDKTVLKIEGSYYCVDDGIWFVSEKPTGPWIVSDVRPDEVDDLPPSAEVYNVKYVYIYDSTPEVVYVGYYPGYTYSYVYGGVVVYGTGYRYHPWYRYYYYPRPVTWGYGVHWNPWTGWGFSIGFSYGWVGWGFHPHPGWWGPCGYRYGYRHGYYRGYHYGYRQGARAGYWAGYHAAQKNPSRNVYRNRPTGIKQTRPAGRDLSKPTLNDRTRASARPNNLYADKKGNVHQRNSNGSWEKKSNARVSQKVSQQPATSQKKPSVDRSRNTQLERSYQSRSRGNSNYNRTKSSGTGQRGGSSRVRKR